MTPELAQSLIPVLASIVTWLVKLGLPKIPKLALPIICALSGPLLDYLSTFATGADANPVLALALGGAGVALREIKSQGSKIVSTS